MLGRERVKQDGVMNHNPLRVAPTRAAHRASAHRLRLPLQDQIRPSQIRRLGGGFSVMQSLRHAETLIGTVSG